MLRPPAKLIVRVGQIDVSGCCLTFARGKGLPVTHKPIRAGISDMSPAG